MRPIGAAAWVSLSLACSTTTTTGTDEQAVTAAVAWTNPYDVTVDPFDNVYVVDLANPTCTLTKIAQDGTSSTVGQFTCNGYTTGVAVDATGTAFVALVRSILKITPDGTVSVLVAANPNDTYPYPRTATFGQIQPGMRLDSSGNLFVVDMFNGGSRIRKITPAGVVSSTVGGSPLGSVGGSAITTPTNVLSTYQNCVITGLGAVVLLGMEYQSGNKDGYLNSALFNWPTGIAAAKNGDLYIVDVGNNEIRKEHLGNVTTLAGAAGPGSWVDGTGSAARFNYPQRLALDSQNNVYVAEGGGWDDEDPGNRAIRKISPTGVVTTFASACGAQCAAGTVCQGSECVACTGETTACGGIACLDLHTDDENCGACGNACASGSSCWNAACVSDFLDIDFGANTTKKTGAAGWGSPGDQWNAVNTASLPTSPLFWADGTPATGVTLTATNLPGAWSWTGEHPVDPMYANYNYSWSGTSASVSVGGLPPAFYEVVVWGKQGKNNTGFYITVLDPTGAVVSTSPTSYTAAAADAATWTTGNQYVGFGVSIAAGQTLQVNLLPGAQGSGNAGMILNGMQLLREP